MNAERNNTSRLLSFEKLHNIRDLGGVAASDGRRIISGKLVRCGNLSELSDRDRVAFSSLAERDYIEEYYRTIDSKYGSFELFLRDGLKLTAEDIHKLQSIYLTFSF